MTTQKMPSTKSNNNKSSLFSQIFFVYRILICLAVCNELYKFCYIILPAKVDGQLHLLEGYYKGYALLDVSNYFLRHHSGLGICLAIIAVCLSFINKRDGFFLSSAIAFMLPIFVYFGITVVDNINKLPNCSENVATVINTLTLISLSICLLNKWINRFLVILTIPSVGLFVVSIPIILSRIMEYLHS